MIGSEYSSEAVSIATISSTDFLIYTYLPTYPISSSSLLVKQWKKIKI